MRGDGASSLAMTLGDDCSDAARVFASPFGRRMRRALARIGTVSSSALLVSSVPSQSLSEPLSASCNALRAYSALLDRLVLLVEPAHFCELIPDDGAMPYVIFSRMYHSDHAAAHLFVSLLSICTSI
jgi:hypothetical protein